MSNLFTTRQAAKKLGISVATLSRNISLGKIPAPQILNVGGKPVHAWTEEQIEAVRELLPKIANGRKTWRQKRKLEKQETEVRSQKSGKKKHSAVGTQPTASRGLRQSVKTKPKNSKP